MVNRSSPTIRDVAAAAQVSVATVSKYVNGTQRFSAPVEAKLKAAVEQLGYRSNPLARSMITGRTRAIGLAILDIRNPHFTSIVRGANRVALRNDHTLLLVDTEESQERERQLIETLAQRVDGMIVSSRMPDEAIEWMVELRKPVVLFGRTRKLPIPSVGTDSRLAAYMLARHLLNEGHRRVAYLGFEQSRWNAERIQGVKDCFKEAGLDIDIHQAQAPSSEAGAQACSAILLGPKPPQAVICYNDLVALGFMREARMLGLRVPQDVSVAGFDNVPYGEYSWPELTTMDLQSERMGELAMQKMLDLLSGHTGDDGYLLLEPRLVVRNSTRRQDDAGRDAPASRRS